MTRALLAFALAFSLGSSAAQPWAESLLRLMHAMPMDGDMGNGSPQAPNGGDTTNGSEPEAGNHWDPDG